MTEFVLAQRLFERHGMATVIADPKDLRYAGGRLTSAGQPIRRQPAPRHLHA